MKDKLCATPVLAFPGFSLPFILTRCLERRLGQNIVSIAKGRGKAHCLSESADELSQAFMRSH